MTPAEKLSKDKVRMRKPRNRSAKPPGPLVCQCRFMRETLELSLRDVSEAVELSVSGLHAIERGNDVQMTTALRLAKFYGVSLDSLWGSRNA